MHRPSISMATFTHKFGGTIEQGQRRSPFGSFEEGNMEQTRIIRLVLDVVLIDRTKPPSQNHELLIRAIPGVVFVPRWMRISWRVEQEIPLPNPLRWEVYFDHGSPFHNRKKPAVIDTEPSNDNGRHSGETKPERAEEDGDYKYGVRVIDLKGDKVLSDDDPYLIVRAP